MTARIIPFLRRPKRERCALCLRKRPVSKMFAIGGYCPGYVCDPRKFGGDIMCTLFREWRFLWQK